MFRNMKKKTKKNSIGKKGQIFFKNSSYPSFVFAFYTLVSPSLQIILKKKITYPSRSQRGAPFLKIEKIGYKLKKWDLDQNSKNHLSFTD